MQQKLVNFIDNKISSTLLGKINLFIFFLIIVWTLTPYLMENTNQFIVILTFGFWWVSVFLYIFMKKKLVISKRLLIPITIIWLAIVSIYILVQMPNFSFGNYFYVILYYMPIFFLVFYLKYGNYSDFKKIITFSFLVLFINAVTNITILIQNPYAAKEATGGYGIVNYSSTNIITDIYIFAYVLTVYGSLIAIKFFSSTIIKFCFAIYSVVATIMILQSTFFIAIISLFLLVVLLIILKDGSKSSTYLKVCLFISSLSLIFLFRDFFLSTIIDWIYAVTDNYIIIHRVEALTKVLTDFSFYGTLEARMKDLVISLKTFTEYPLFGRGYLLSDDIYSTGIGMHSHLLDDLARFGIFVFTFQLLVYAFFVKYVNRLLEIRTRKLYVISWIGFTFYALFNPIVYPPAGIALFFILPMTIIYLDSMSSRRKEV
ncbi:hypothetical protein [Bacillus sp. E(2018)]|uniref:hypothetical protein n=1 Tax=Bacillus sp. E(2018) TaxID=2502239 RepID=UPI0010F867DF|nr:hypothetical protein [Bacillus sp. E(2018)]